MTNGIGYSHALFSSGSNLRQMALNADKKENGGNNNGLLDGDEIAKFSQAFKSKTGVDFDFSNIKQATKKSIPIQDNKGNFIFKNGTDIANTYKSATSKSTNWLNGKQEGKDIFIPRNKSLYIAFMDEKDYMASKSSANAQERIIKEKLENNKQTEAQENQRKKNPSWINNLEDLGKKIFK